MQETACGLEVHELLQVQAPISRFSRLTQRAVMAMLHAPVGYAALILSLSPGQ